MTKTVLPRLKRRRDPPLITDSLRDYWEAFIAAAKHSKQSSDPDPEISRRLLISSIDMLDRFFSAANYGPDRTPIAWPPCDIGQGLVDILRKCVNGDKVPILDLVRPKTKKRSLDADAALDGMAIYVNAVRKWPDYLNDPDPIETVRVAFGMTTKSQVYKHLRERDPVDTNPADFMPERVGKYTDDQEYLPLFALFEIRMRTEAARWRVLKTSVARNYARSSRREAQR